MLSALKKQRRAAEIEEELRKISALIEAAERDFNEVSDSDLIEAAIYDRSALLARYSYLLRLLRRLGEGD